MVKEEKILEKKFLTVSELYNAMGGFVSKQHIYRMINNGEIPVRVFGSRIAIDGNWARSYISTPCVCTKKHKTGKNINQQ